VSEPAPSSPSAAGGVPPEGLLEELDGTPIRPLAAARPTSAMPWRRGAAAAAAIAAGRPRLWAFALVAFLARGGIVVLVFPIVVLPTFIGIANLVGPASVSAAGPSPRLLALIVAGVAGVAALAVAGTLVAAAAETALHLATVEPDAGTVGGDAGEPREDDGEPGGDSDPGRSLMAVARPRGGAGAVARVAAIRLALLMPVAVVTALAVPPWIAVAYRELTLPSDVAAPLLLRVLAGVPAAGLAVLLAWLAAELVGGFAIRRVVLLGETLPGALGRGCVDPVRAPVGTLLTVLVAAAVTVLALAPAIWALGAAWDVTRPVFVDGAGPLEALATGILLTAAWAVALLLAGIAAALRATLVTAELLRRGRRS
jgi:hypothetical protein